jgi:transcription-repair coupling factor (superfamily II helicase)
MILETAAALVRFFNPTRHVLLFPAWDCLPYDRVSPKKDIMAMRLRTLDQLLQAPLSSYCILTTLSAIGQRLPPRTFLQNACSLQKGNRFAFSALIEQLCTLGFTRTETVFSPGEFSVRGGIIDIFPASEKYPYRIDFFDDEIERIRIFNPETQRSQEDIEALRLSPVGEVVVASKAREIFVQRYREIFKASGDNDPFFEAIAACVPYAGQEHWLPLFYEQLTSFFTYLPPGTFIILPTSWQKSIQERTKQIADFFTARLHFLEQKLKSIAGARYCPISPDLLYLTPQEWETMLSAMQTATVETYMTKAHCGENFLLDRHDLSTLVQKAAHHIETAHKIGKKVLLTCATEGARTRILHAFSTISSLSLTAVDTWETAQKESQKGNVPVVRLRLHEGFVFPDLWVLTDADLWGERLGRPTTRHKKARPLKQIPLITGDYVVHEDHGIGQYKGIQTLTIDAICHDYLELWYDKGDKLYVPVEDLEVISRYGPADVTAPLDRLGTLQWQNRKARVKERIGAMAQKLIDLAAQRLLKEALPLETSTSAQDYDLFCARFPYPETEDQLRAITDVEADFRSGHFTDRLICGDVGFGKTEVALRAAFSMVASGKQVAIIVPTTLLCRQHFYTFSERFAGFPFRIAFLSRLTPHKDVEEIKKAITDGKIDIIIGTHTLLKGTLQFHDLGLLIVDEEQHFGVKQKEHLKALCTDVHVLTLTATPIPRTLQLSLTGVRDLSLIASSPIDRRAVHTFITPFDPVILREAILRERARRGQVFYVCPRIGDLAVVAQFLQEFIPEARFCTAHGQMPTQALETTIGDFLDGHYDGLLATNIIESGIDIPTANTLILHHSDCFGLSQLYQLRGRVGRSQVQAYAYFTYDAKRPLSEHAQKRLEILEHLDHLGAGFTLASFDLDLRGAGNLLGEEQSGHIREVGVELYQNMLKQAVEVLKNKKDCSTEENFSPQLSLGISVLIPEPYVRDLSTKLDLYRRAAAISTEEEEQELVDELIERFGPLPLEVKNLFTVIRFRNMAKKAHVQRLDLGTQKMLLSFRNFPNPAGLLALIEKSYGTMRLHSSDKISINFTKDQSLEERLEYSAKILTLITKIAQKSPHL